MEGTGTTCPFCYTGEGVSGELLSVSNRSLAGGKKNLATRVQTSWARLRNETIDMCNREWGRGGGGVIFEESWITCHGH